MATNTQTGVIASRNADGALTGAVSNTVAVPGAPAAGFVTIKASTVAINPVDWKMIDYDFFVSQADQVLGCDVAGTVTAVGEGVTNFSVGDRVAAYVPIDLASGAFQETVNCPATAVLPLADGVSFEQGATIPVALYTALVFARGGGPSINLTTGGNTAPLLVWGGSSSVGQSTVQLYSKLGFTVITTASPKHHAHLQAIGASHVVDYRADDAVAQLQAVFETTGVPSIAFDCISADSARTCASLLSADGPAFLATVGAGMDVMDDLPEHVTHTPVLIAMMTTQEDLAAFYAENYALLAEVAASITPQAVQVVEGGWDGVLSAISVLREGVSGVKVVVNVE